ncbi:hypothetical protein C8F01DRAFT_1246305 [Mycena amicta]|nr:hypothetical protein C8F01DRAFT_1246305 [Mycena amicta]
MALPYEFREYPLDRYSDAEVDAENNKQMAARKLALQAPLQAGLQFTLALETPLQNPAPNARKLPRVPGPGPTVVQLRDELQLGIDGFSQVWTAECVDDPGTCLVLKIMQPSICRGLPEDPRDPHYDAWNLAHNEAWVYQNLPHYQGVLIPYFFGLSTLVTPCGEEAWVLVLEFICGLTVKDVVQSASISTIHDFCALGVNAVREFVHGGWTLLDIQSSNFILTGGPGAWAVVIIDIFLSEPMESNIDRERMANYQAQDFFFKFVFDVLAVDKDIYTWAEKNLIGVVLLLPSPPDSDDEK